MPSVGHAGAPESTNQGPAASQKSSVPESFHLIKNTGAAQSSNIKERATTRKKQEAEQLRVA